jgi:predicted Zn-dependent protease
MKNIICNIFSLLILSSGFINAQNISYDFSCMEIDEASALINVAAEIEQNAIRNYGQSVTIGEEMRLGVQLLNDLKSKYNVYEYGERHARMKAIMNSLVSKITSPRGFTYRIFLFNADELNAFTCGGKIFITKKMYHFCQNDSELAAIIGHEIAHNELKHIRDNISRYKTASSFGSAGQMTALIGSMLTTPFNQKSEVHCDFYGIDLMKKAGYSICSAPEIWRRMAAQENETSELDKFASTHPYSKTRQTCCLNHIESNYKKSCAE